MALKTGIFSLALGALLLGSTAQADDTQKSITVEAEVQAKGFRGGHDQYHRYDDDEYSRRHHPGPIQVHVHTSHCNHAPQPPPPSNQYGRYELKFVQKFIPGRYEQVWVPQDCRYKPRRGTTKCRGGYYEQRWVAGHYETVEEWVWVPGRWQRSTGPEWTAPASYRY